MTNPATAAQPQHPVTRPEPSDAWADSLAVGLATAQQLQFAWMMAAAQVLHASYGELWDLWACRWAGGVPIDG